MHRCPVRSVDTADRLRQEIGRLREYRPRLIADVVTGKLDVREAPSRLPDEPDEREDPEPRDADGALADTDPDDVPADDTHPRPEEDEA